MNEIIKNIKYKLIKKNFLSFKKSIKKAKTDADKQFIGMEKKIEQLCKKIKQVKIDLMLDTTEILIQECIQKNPLIIVNILSKALKNISEHTDVDVYANPKDVVILRSNLTNVTKSCLFARKITLLEDENLLRGSIIARANKSIIDAQISTQLAELKNIFKIIN
jgi:flagellar biosynthesis/type III secretory pathway protein FliH